MDLVDDEDDIHDARLESLFLPSARDLILPAVAFDSDDDDKYDGDDKEEPRREIVSLSTSPSNLFDIQADNEATAEDINAGAEDKNDEVPVEELSNEPVVSQARRGLDDIRERLRRTQERLAARRVGLSQYFDKEAREMVGKSAELEGGEASEESGDSEEMHGGDSQPTESVTTHAAPSLASALLFNPFDRILANNRAEQQKLNELIIAIKACSPMRPPVMPKWSPPTHDDSVFSSPCPSDSGSESPSSTAADGAGSVWEESEASISSRSTPCGPRASTWDRPDISPLRYGPRLSRTPTFYDNDNCNNEDGDDTGDEQAVLMCSITYREESADDHILSPVPRPSFGLWDLEPVNPRLEVESESESESEFDVALQQMPTRIPVWAGLGRRTPGQKVVMSAAEMERRLRVVPEIIAKRKAQEAKEAQKVQDEARQAQAQASSPTLTRLASPPVAGPSAIRPCARHGRVQQQALTPASQPVAGPGTVRARTARQPISAPAAPAATKPDRKGKGKAPVRAAKPAWRF
ncbi:hypothetical protein BOTBODRAFT_583428 [Botryobasidium botryosum FD-172 SS1]|uniref:Uncharacterized protein n=1 Tax=Botryobasidium botryosum (strain FD-172 SS1) TaxID=930990 RepID=A0A067MPY6_BOTB1|nr:hypothetical protein BOTBODRAFT_583428 [Botryobasidium botryosum FD-172 SS1]